MPSTSRVKLPVPRNLQDPWYEVFVAFAEAIDKGIYSAWEDRNFILMGGGRVAFDAPTGVLTWSQDLELLSAVTGFILRVVPGAITLEEGEIFYATVIRGPQSPPALTTSKSTQLPNTVDGFDYVVLAVRRDNRIYFRNGDVLLNGESLELIRTGTTSGASDAGAPTSADKELTPLVTTGDESPTGLTLTESPVGERYVTVHVNGISYSVGNGDKLHHCYFSDDGGTTALSFSGITMGSELIWNGAIAGFELTITDTVDLDYDVSGLATGLVTGPAGATDNAITRFDGITGKLLQNSTVLIDDTGNITLPALSTVDGVDVSDHASRHQPGGADPLSTAAPVSIGLANSEGISTSFARATHVHAHGNLPGGALHAEATPVTAGFMSAADKAALDALGTGGVFVPIRNETGVTLDKGALVSVAGFSIPEDRLLVQLADKDDSARRPAVGFVVIDIPDGTNGSALSTGVLLGVDTSAFAITDQLMLGNNGAYIRPPPDNPGQTGEVQLVGSVGRVSATDGSINVILDGLAPTTADQVYALAGTDGTPSDTNRYVTDSDPRNTDTRTPSAHAASHQPATGTDPLLTDDAGTANSGDAPSAGVSDFFSRSDHTHGFPAPADPPNVNASPPSAGTSSVFAREDHTHQADTGIAGTASVGDAASAGVGPSLSRNDHVHGFTAPAAPPNVNTAPPSAGVSGNFAREDHAHQVSTATPGNCLAGDVAAEGTALTLARSDHMHGMPVAVPVDVGTVNSAGSSTSLSRADHVHSHANQAGGALHAVATVGTAGFMSATDKTKLDGLPTSAVPTTRTLTAGAGLTGGGDLSADRTFDAVANADGSIVVNPNDIQVGVLATDAQHGVRGGGTQHAVATVGVAGFLSAADKTKLDGLPTSAVPTTRTLTAGAGMTGGGDLSADRTFDVIANADGSIVVNANDVQVGILATDAQHGTRGGGTLHAVATGIVAGFMSSTDKTKLDGVATGATNTPLTASAPVNVTKDAAVVGVATDAARADHKHDITTAAAIDLTDATNAEGTATTLARSDHTHSHGARGGGTLHADATLGVSGFMSAADKTKLTGIATGANVSVLRQTTFTELGADTTTTSATFVTLLTQVITPTAGGILIINFTFACSNSSGSAVTSFRITIDAGVQRGVGTRAPAVGDPQGGALTIRKTGLSAAAHTVLIEWKTTGGTSSIRPASVPNNEHASLVIMEVSA